MAVIFLTDGIGQAITRCWLDGKDVTRLAVRVNIPAVEDIADMPPAIAYNRRVRVLACSGSIDLLATDDEGHFVTGPDQQLIPVRHYGMIKLVWGASMRGGSNA